MKQKIFMYLFVFSILVVVFQFVNSKRVFEDMNHKIGNYKIQFEKYKDSVLVLNNNIEKASYFSLEKNEDAITYFENEGYNIDKLIPFIKDELYRLNEAEGQHPLVPYAASEGRKILINTVKILNHKWIIANFSDGEYWGEIFVTYEITKDRAVIFNLSESFLYPFD